MDNYAEEYFDQERYAVEQLEKSKLHAKIFNCVFHDILDNLMFISLSYLKTVHLKFCLGYLPSEVRDTFSSSLFRMTYGDSEKDFNMFLDFSMDEVERIKYYFQAAILNGNFMYKDFPLKSMITNKIGGTILHFLENSGGNVKIYKINILTNKKDLFFAAKNVEELMIKMDLT